VVVGSEPTKILSENPAFLLLEETADLKSLTQIRHIARALAAAFLEAPNSGSRRGNEADF